MTTLRSPGGLSCLVTGTRDPRQSVLGGKFGLGQASPLKALPDLIDTDIKVIRHDRLGGLLHEYSQVA